MIMMRLTDPELPNIEDEWPEDIVLPLKTVRDIRRFESKLKDDKDFQKLYVSHFTMFTKLVFLTGHFIS